MQLYTTPPNDYFVGPPLTESTAKILLGYVSRSFAHTKILTHSSFAASNRFSSKFTIYLAHSIFPSTLTTFAASAGGKPSHSMMLKRLKELHPLAFTFPSYRKDSWISASLFSLCLCSVLSNPQSVVADGRSH
ncbi:hypothetical protein ATANTOWER_032062 [Ataeniobius toweri]|uniref:Uncharacterized protein n=1 Tax=Ataeniobius toweri TaxID=208326 RepID=A0ABU7ACH7_9TELE|nr:hypothetical protein [Ataeniobius toweri]